MSSRAESSKGLDSKEGRVNEADHDQSSFVLGSMTIKKNMLHGCLAAQINVDQSITLVLQNACEKTLSTLFDDHFFENEGASSL